MFLIEFYANILQSKIENLTFGIFFLMGQMINYLTRTDPIINHYIRNRATYRSFHISNSQLSWPFRPGFFQLIVFTCQSLRRSSQKGKQ